MLRKLEFGYKEREQQERQEKLFGMVKQALPEATRHLSTSKRRGQGVPCSYQQRLWTYGRVYAGPLLAILLLIVAVVFIFEGVVYM